jgi:hypothetical protein
MTRISSRIRHHLPFLVMLALLIISTTWPTAALVFETDRAVFPTTHGDVRQKLWDVWHLQQFLAGETRFYYSDVMFYPVGVSLAYESFSLPHMVSVAVLSAFLPLSNAYTLTYLLIVFAVAASAYMYLHYLLRDRWLAALGAAVFGLCQFVIAHAGHPGVNIIVSFPLSAYFFQRGLKEERIRYFICCGVIVGFTAFSGLYIFICQMITLALFALYYAFFHWRDPRFWRWMLLLGLVIGLASAPRLAPILAQPGLLDDALSKNSNQESATDLMYNLVNYRHPITTPLLKSLFGVGKPHYEWNTSYLGYLPLALIFLGFARRAYRRRMLPWLGLALLFLLLRLGSVLQIDGYKYSQIVLPKSLLADLLPPLFDPFHVTDHFQMGVLLPLAVMTCYGLQSLLEARPAKQRALITLAVIAAIAFEYYEPTEVKVLPAEQIAFINWLQEEESNGEPRLINLPMGRQHSKHYGFYQTYTGFPQAEGLSGRTPPQAYRFIEGNPMLRAWRRGAAVHCLPPLQADYLSALEQLLGAGFTHVVWHHWLGADKVIESSFVDAPIAYGDDYARVYRLEDLRRNCDWSSTVSAAAIPHLQALEASSAVFPQHDYALVSLLDEADADAGQQPTGAGFLFGSHRFAPLALIDGDVAAPDFDILADDGADAAALLAEHFVLLLVYNPQKTDAKALRSYREWIGARFKTCRRLADDDEAVIEYILHADFPCALALAAQPLAVDYDNGTRLGNVLVDSDAGGLALHLLWARLPAESHAISLQIFDDGDKVAGTDFTVGLEPLAYRRADISSWPPGEFDLKLILYNYDSGVSVPGAIVSSGERFERELAIGRITID